MNEKVRRRTNDDVCIHLLLSGKRLTTVLGGKVGSVCVFFLVTVYSF